MDTLSALLPNFQRLRMLTRELRTISLTRALQYEVISKYLLKGDVLDFGGGEKTLYKQRLNCTNYKSINIDPNILPTWISSVGEPFPCQNESFDTVLSMNTLEHIFDPIWEVSEMFRVLLKNGELILSVPFLFPIHGHPDDYFRPTPSWYRQALAQAGFKNVEIIPLSWGPFSVSFTCSGLPGPFKFVRKYWALVLDLIYYNIYIKRKIGTTDEYLTRFATAFFVRAVK